MKKRTLLRIEQLEPRVTPDVSLGTGAAAALRVRAGRCASDSFKTGAGRRPSVGRMGVQFEVIGLVVADLEASLAFYRTLGLAVPDNPDPEHVEIPLTGGVRLALDPVTTIHSFDPEWTAPKGGPATALAFRCGTPDEVDRVYAELVNHRYPGRGVVRTLFITPFLVMPVVGALTWKNMMLNPVFGVIDYVMQLLGLPAVDWLAQFPLASITGMVVWRWAPFMMLILLAGMQSLSDEIREAARVDGVSAVQEFRYIVLPHLNRFIQLGALLGSIYIVQEFDSIYMTTQGGPGTASTNLPFLIYQVAFAKTDVGEASALGVIVVIMTIIATRYLLRVLTKLFEGD